METKQCKYQLFDSIPSAARRLGSADDVEKGWVGLDFRPEECNHGAFQLNDFPIFHSVKKYAGNFQFVAPLDTGHSSVKGSWQDPEKGWKLCKCVRKGACGSVKFIQLNPNALIILRLKKRFAEDALDQNRISSCF